MTLEEMITRCYLFSLLVLLTLPQVWSFQHKPVARAWMPPIQHICSPRMSKIKSIRSQNNVLKPPSFISHYNHQSPTGSGTTAWSTATSSQLFTPASLAANQHLLFSLDDNFLPTNGLTSPSFTNPLLVALATIIKVSLSVVMLYLGLHGVAFIQDVLFVLSSTNSDHHPHRTNFWKKLTRSMGIGRQQSKPITQVREKSSSTTRPIPLSTKPIPTSSSTSISDIHRNSRKISTVSSSSMKGKLVDHKKYSGSLTSTKMMRQNFPWLKCNLVDKYPINQRYLMYTFETTEEDKVLSKNTLMSRQMIICAPDKDGKLIKEQFYPLLVPGRANQFQIMVDSQEESPVINAINDIDLADINQENLIGCKVGPSIISYRGPENRIRYLTIVASQLGIAPVLQLIESILSRTDNGDSELDIDGIELIWINDAKESFVLNKLVEEMEEKFANKFSCIRIVDKGIHSPNNLLHAKVKKILPGTEPGRVAIVAGSPTVVEKFSNVLVNDQKYHMDNIIPIIVPMSSNP